eukprot:GFYU01004153.1.p1 GENE.GFYU01004153.1~~GFYU01004153.1.p1  ORF type:complete len:1070 (+),score=318.07 GFYU01004153.1:283-3492(+)
MASLDQLGTVLEQFFNPALSNDQKRNLEIVIVQARRQPDAWRQCQPLLLESPSPYVKWFACSVYEELVKRRWGDVSPEEKAGIRTFLLEALLSQHAALPGFVQVKLEQVIVDIGKNDWPVEYPDFLAHIQQIITNPTTSVVGLKMLSMVAEDFVSAREDLLASRKAELKVKLSEHLPGLLALLFEILDSLWGQRVTFTPPGSPVNPRKVNPNQRKNAWRMLFDNNFDQSTSQIAGLALEALQHFISWISLNEHVNSSWLVVLFKYIWIQDDNSIPAMCCVIEMLSKNCMPRDLDNFLAQIFQQTSDLIAKLTESEEVIRDVDETYNQKFKQMIHMFYSNHMSRVDSYPLGDFFAHYFKYTFFQEDVEEFLECLDTWTVFLDYLIREQTCGRPKHDAYFDGLMILLTEIFKRIQFSQDTKYLSQLSDSKRDSEEESELGAYVKKCVDVISKIAKLYASSVLEELCAPFWSLAEQYTQVHSMFGGDGCSSPHVLSRSDNNRIANVLEDLCTMMQIVSYVADHFVSEFEGRFAHASNLFNTLIQVGSYSASHKLYLRLNVQGKSLVKVQTRLLGTMHSFTVWLEYYNKKAAEQTAAPRSVASPPLSPLMPPTGTASQDFNKIIGNVLELVAATFIPMVPDEILIAAGNLLISLTTVVRPHGILSIPQMISLVQNVHSLVVHLPRGHYSLIYLGVSNSMLLPPSNANDDWSQRQALYSEFLSGLVGPLKEIPGMVGTQAYLQPTVKEMVVTTTKVLYKLIQSIKSEPKVAKETFHQAAHEALPVYLTLVQLYTSEPAILEEMLNLFLCLFEVLKQQIGVPFIEQTVSTFFTLFTGEQLQATRSSVVVKFAQLLTFLVQDPKKSFKMFTPNVMALCLNDLSVMVQQESSSVDLRSAYYKLVYNVVLFNWNAWFPLGGGGGESTESFSQMMEKFMTSFLQSDIGVFKSNLEALEDLNAKRRLYERPVFQQNMCFAFLETLTKALLNKSHDLLREEIITTMYHMIIAIGFEHFFQNFLPYVLQNAQVINDGQKGHLLQTFSRDTDAPTFSKNMSQFINDYCYFSMQNGFGEESSHT